MVQCKLCLKHVPKLQNSHFLSKGIYKRLRDENEKNPNPWVLSKGKAVQTSKQIRKHLLCMDCEERFNKYGEDWVLSNCLQEDGSFPLASILATRSPGMSANDNPTRVYYASSIPEINIAALAFFAASIFWRGSVFSWNADGSVPVRLGPFQEQFRLYLLGLKAFPEDSSLWVAVRKGKETDRLTHPPISNRMEKFHVHKFPMPGLVFTLVIGKHIPDNCRTLCLVRGLGNPIFVTTIIEKFIMDTAVKILGEKTKI